MVVLGSRLGRTVLGITIGISLCTSSAFAQATGGDPLDPYQPAPPPGAAPKRVRIAAPPIVAPPAETAAPTPPPAPPAPPPAPPASSSVGTTIDHSNVNTNTVSPIITANPTNTNTSNPTNTNTANPHNTNTNTNNPVQTNTSTNNNDNKSNAAATATNNNTIYIYPPQTPPPPPVVAAPTLLPPPLVPPPTVAPPYTPTSPYYNVPNRRLNCDRWCNRQPYNPYNYAPLYGQYTPTVRKPKPLEKFRVVTLGGHYTMFGMANQPLTGWGTLYGGGISLEFRSRGRFGFELSQDFLRGQFKSNGSQVDRKSYPFEFTFKGYIMPNTDKNHFNMYFGGGLGAMTSNVSLPGGDYGQLHQDFLEWMIHGDLGAELRFKWLSLGVDGRIEALYRDRSYGAGAFYGDIKNAPIPASTWGLQGRAFMNFSF